MKRYRVTWVDGSSNIVEACSEQDAFTKLFVTPSCIKCVRSCVMIN